MSLPAFFKKMQASLMAAVAGVAWLFLGMVFLDRYVPPFDRLAPVLMPWKGLRQIPVEASLSDRLSFMQNVLDASAKVAHYAFVAMLLSLASLIVYLTIVYQQKQQRARENRFLMLKNQEIARRTEFIRYIAATIGHEFKNNLGRIKRRIDLLPGLPADARERIDDNLSKLFADIDVFKRISDEREAGLIAFTKVDLREVLAGIARQYRDLAHISVRETAPSPLIYASLDLLKTVFENVIDNAVRYKKRDQEHARITLACDMDTDASRSYVTISVRDEGIGMDEQQADQCFYKGKGSGEGWGQGLYFAKYVVGLHAGKIRVGREYTAPGRGTEIIINLPFVEESMDV